MQREGLEIDILETVARAARLEPEWTALGEGSSTATPFQSAEWVLECWRHFEPDARRALVTMRAAGQLVGLAPLRWRSDSLVTLEGEEASDYLDVLAAHEHRARVSAALLAVLADLGVARCAFERLEAWSPLLARRPGDPWRTSLGQQDVCPYLPIPAGARHPSEIVPPSLWRRMRRTVRSSARRGRTELRWADGRGGEAAIERLFRLHGSRWQARGEAGALANETTRDFHRAVAPQLLARGRAWLVELWIDDAPAAAIYALIAPRRALSYIGGFEPAFARWSPGRQVLAAVTERAARSSFEEIDFLRGVEAYKYDWGARDRSTRRLDLERRLAGESPPVREFDPEQPLEA